MDGYTLTHVIISLIAIASGGAVLVGMLYDRRLDRTTLLFVLFSALTNLTGFGFPITGQTPALVLGVVSSIVLLVSIVARYAMRMRGAWRTVYVVTAAMVLWFNVFVLIVQSFQKVPALHALAPTGAELPFAAAQGVVLVAFIVSGLMAAMRFKP
ncbi:MAG: hypothetical protein JOZ72_00905 [Alphaproteobacteria bacterium]|nr:hypothetical protein [Alphaproteobacteria bacterium]